jgi:hypothetical protein
MDFILSIIRILMAILSPLAVIVLSILTLVQLREAAGTTAETGETCLRCGKSLPGGEGQFHFTEGIGNARERAAKKQFSVEQTPILGSESHFVCDKCAHRHIHIEILQQIALVLPYPLLLYGIIPLLGPSPYFSNVLVETLLVVLSLSSLVSAIDLYRAVRQGNTPLDEARDQVAIKARRKALGKKLSYYTRMGMTQLNK